MKSKGPGSILALIASLILTACGAQQAAKTFITEHTACAPEDFNWVTWSKDISLIYYSVRQGFSPGIYVMHPDGSDNRGLIRDGYNPMLSPDGTHLLFARANPAANLTQDYFLIDLSSMSIKSTGATGTNAAWSPDSQWIVYLAMDSWLETMKKTNLFTGQTVQLTPASGTIWDAPPVWSPDGKRIAFGSDISGLSAVYIMNADGSNVTRLTQPLAYDDCPWGTGDTPQDWLASGDGLAVARMCGSGSHTALRMVDLTGADFGNWRWVGLDSWFEQWSPDGGRVLLSSGYQSSSNIVVANVDGTHARLLATHAWSPRWSPDGKRIVYVGLDPANLNLPEIFVMNADGSGVTQITNNAGKRQVCLH